MDDEPQARRKQNPGKVVGVHRRVVRATSHEGGLDWFDEPIPVPRPTPEADAERPNRFLVYRDKPRRWVVRNTRTGYYLPGSFPTWVEAYATAHRLSLTPRRVGFRSAG